MSKSILGNTTELGSAVDFTGRYGRTALRFYLLALAREIIPDERIKVCWRYPLPNRTCIEIIYSQELKRARSSGTMKCGSAWVCPACMMYIQERRRQELKTALERSKNKYFSVLVTYTSRHHQGMKLVNILNGLQSAFRGVKTGRMWQLIKQDYMLVGSVKAIEITHGQHGWHPHFHELILVDRKMLDDNYVNAPDEFAQSLCGQMEPRWLKSLGYQGLSGETGIALNVRSSRADVADYVAKYGKMPQNADLNVSTDEVAYSVSKTPRGGNLGVLDILYASAEDNDYKRLFREYHFATKGRSQLQWSRGLKALLDIEIIRDEIAAEGIETESDVLLAEINLEHWKYISTYGHMGQVMTYANKGDTEALGNLLRVIYDKYEQNWSDGGVRQFDRGH